MAETLYYAGAILTLAEAITILWIVLVWGKRLINGEKCQLRHDMLSTYYKIWRCKK